MYTESYSVPVIIVDHFDAIINRIDVQTETILQNKKPNEEDTNELNNLRRRQINMIEQLKMYNLAANAFTDESFYQKWKNLIDDDSVMYSDKMDAIKKDLIRHDCVLIKEATSKSELVLCVFRWFNNAANVRLLRYNISLFVNIFV